MHEVLKRKDGTIVTAKLLGTPRDHIFKTCGRGHKLKWGPFCRVMKRPPRGREYVVLECKTCGDYVEIVNPNPIEIAQRGKETERRIIALHKKHSSSQSSKDQLLTAFRILGESPIRRMDMWCLINDATNIIGPFSTEQDALAFALTYKDRLGQCEARKMMLPWHDAWSKQHDYPYNDGGDLINLP